MPALHVERTGSMNHYIGYDTNNNFIIGENVDMVSTVRLSLDPSGHFTPGANNTGGASTAGSTFGSTDKRWDTGYFNHIENTPVYDGAATGFPSGSAANVWHEITAFDFTGPPGGGSHFFIQMSWMNHNTTYGYTVQIGAYYTNNGVNSSPSYQGNTHWTRHTLGTGPTYSGLPCTHSVHTSSSALQVQLYLSEDPHSTSGYPPIALYVNTNAATTSAPTLRVYRINN
jgi:hypothetical protein